MERWGGGEGLQFGNKAKMCINSSPLGEGHLVRGKVMGYFPYFIKNFIFI
ncbi:MAG: hypothetical protein Fur0025_15000 [Oscillatoriaceae cyanobacterium]